MQGKINSKSNILKYIVTNKQREIIKEEVMKESFVDEIMNTIPQFKQMLTVDYIARKIDLSDRTVRRYIENGKLEALNFSIEGRSVYRIPRAAFRRFLETYYTMRDCL